MESTPQVVQPADESHAFLEGVMAAMFYPIAENIFVWRLLAPILRLKEVGLKPRTRARGPRYFKGNHQPGGDSKATENGNSHLIGLQHEASSLSVKEVPFSLSLACLLCSSSVTAADRCMHH